MMLPVGFWDGNYFSLLPRRRHKALSHRAVVDGCSLIIQFGILSGPRALCTHSLDTMDSFCSQSVTLIINSSGTSWSAEAAAGNSGCKSDVNSLNTMFMLLARASVSLPHSWPTRSHKCDLDGCSPISVLIVFHHCL